MWAVYVDWFFRLLGWATSLVSCRFRGCGLFMLIGFFYRLLGWHPFIAMVNTWFLLLFLLIFAANVVVLVLMFLFLWCLVKFRGCGVFTLAGSLSSWLEYTLL
jgi:hypothetical protein